MTIYQRLHRDLQWLEETLDRLDACVPYSTAYPDPYSESPDFTHFLRRLFEYDTHAVQAVVNERFPDPMQHRFRAVHFNDLIGDDLNDVQMRAMNDSASDLRIDKIIQSCGDVAESVIRTYDAVEAQSMFPHREHAVVTELLLYSLLRSDQLYTCFRQMMHSMSQIPTIFSPYLCDIVNTAYGPEHDFQWGVRAALEVHILTSAMYAFDHFDYRRDAPIAWQRELFLADFCAALLHPQRVADGLDSALHHVRRDAV